MAKVRELPVSREDITKANLASVPLGKGPPRKGTESHVKGGGRLEGAKRAPFSPGGGWQEDPVVPTGDPAMSPFREQVSQPPAAGEAAATAKERGSQTPDGERFELSV